MLRFFFLVGLFVGGDVLAPSRKHSVQNFIHHQNMPFLFSFFYRDPAIEPMLKKKGLL